MQEIHISMQERIFPYVLTIGDVLDSTAVMHVNDLPIPIHTRPHSTAVMHVIDLPIHIHIRTHSTAFVHVNDLPIHIHIRPLYLYTNGD